MSTFSASGEIFEKFYRQQSGNIHNINYENLGNNQTNNSNNSHNSTTPTSSLYTREETRILRYYYYLPVLLLDAFALGWFLIRDNTQLLVHLHQRSQHSGPYSYLINYFFVNNIHSSSNNSSSNSNIPNSAGNVVTNYLMNIINLDVGNGGTSGSSSNSGTISIRLIDQLMTHVWITTRWFHFLYFHWYFRFSRAERSYMLQTMMNDPCLPIMQLCDIVEEVYLFLINQCVWMMAI